MNVHRLEEGQFAAHAEFLARQPNALLYQALNFQDFLCHVLGARRETVVATDANGQIQGVLPLISRPGPCGAVWNSLPFYGSNGDVLAASPEARAQLFDWYNANARLESVASSTIVTSPFETTMEHEVAHNCVDFRTGQLSPIAHSDDHASNLMRGFHFKTRNMIRKAQKSGVEVAIENDKMTFLRHTHEANLAALGGQAKPAAFFDSLPEFFSEGKDYQIYVARYQNEPVAALLLFYFKASVEYYVPVIHKEFRDTQAMSLLIFEAMCEASRRGFEWWNWGGTGHAMDGVYRFKHRWGAQDRKYFYYTQLNRPEMATWRREAVLKAYPNFFVFPFSMLESTETG